jgi:hypothetical protein
VETSLFPLPSVFSVKIWSQTYGVWVDWKTRLSPAKEN